MHFKKLELIGFKSFAEKTVLNFEPGFTAVVGPNGCGKSNIFDAIRWVLGEQSVKALRGAKMEDVIFNGTEKIPALGFAEVSLTFSNENKIFPVDYEEVIVSRRLFRSGESEYIMNKTPVRLKDIEELFMGTGIGAGSYSLVEQGKVDLILSSRAEDRRLVFDEASGITKYKSQKKESIHKIEDTEQNLLRINDIITEVKRQIGSLERQANKAKRYKEVFDQLKDVEIKLATFQITDIEGQSTGISKQIEDYKFEQVDNTKLWEELKKELTQYNEQLESKEKEIASIKDRQNLLENLIEIDSQHINMNRERIEELKSRLKDLEEQKINLNTRLIQEDDKVKTLKKGLLELERRIQEKKDLLKEKDGTHQGILKDIETSNKNINETKKSILELINTRTQLNNGLTELNGQLQNLSARKRRLEIEKFKVDEEGSTTLKKLDEINSVVISAEDEFNQLNANLDDSLDSLKRETEVLNKLQGILKKFEDEKLGLESQREFLKGLKRRYENIPEVFHGFLLINNLPKEKISGILAQVDDIKEIDKKDTEIQGMRYKLSCMAKPIPLDTKQIDDQIDQITKEIDKSKKELDSKELDIKRLTKDIENKKIELHQKEIKLNNKKTEQKTIETQLNKLREELDLVNLELTEVNSDLDKLTQEESSFKGNYSILEDNIRKSQDFIEQQQESISKNTSLREENIIFITQTKTEIEASGEQINSQNRTLSLLETSWQQSRSDLELREKEEFTCKEKLQDLEKEIKDLENQIQKSKEEKEELEKFLLELQGQFYNSKRDMQDVQNKISSLQNKLEEIQASLYQFKMQEQQLNFKKDSVRERILQAYKISLEAKAKVSLDTDIEGVNLQINNLKEKLDSYGQVNLVAIDEYEDLKKRYEFLINQQNDLLVAKESLSEAINKINRTARKLFIETFEKIQVEFRNYFRLLFGGGDSQLILVDEEDVLDSGIEIICRPPGKKLQNISLLSGGEKALSAIALLFAIFKVKPSPFCVLDEIDSALDESNIDRFSRILQEFTKTSQFIVITHNKKTIANADVMYGITMQESGISKIVSVKFSQEKKEDSKVTAAKKSA